MKKIFIFFISLSFLISLISSQSIFILQSAEEKTSTEKNILSFEIEAGINENIESNTQFQILSEFYENNHYIKELNIGCNIPRISDATFGTKIKIKCSVDLYEKECLKANKIKFIKFIKDGDLKITDNKQNVIGNDLIFEKRIKEEKKKEEINIKADIEFTAENIILEKYIGNKLIFLIQGQYNSIFTLGFNFNLNINNNIEAQCKSPNLIFEKEAKINCSLLIESKIIESIKDGITIKEGIYRIRRSFTEEKILKFSIKNGDKLEIKEFNLNKEQIYNKEDNEENEEKKSEWEIQREIERKRREREKEEEKRKKDQEDLENLLKRRQQIEKEQNNNNNNNNYNYNNNQNDNNYNRYSTNNENDIIDYNSNVKLIHVQVRYSYDIIYYMFYALTPIPFGHKIKVGFTLTTGGYGYGESNKINKNIILKTEEEITQNDKSVIIEYVARFECPQCKKIVLDKNSIYGATIYNIPNEEYLLDAINVNQNGNYLQKNKMTSPPLYITENIFNQNCILELAGNFFNKNKFFISKFPLNLIGTGYYTTNRNVTLYCGLNEREIFSCPIKENLNNFEFKLEPLIFNQKENIIIDNFKMTKDRMTFRASCQTSNLNNVNTYGNNANTQSKNDYIKNPGQMPDVLIQKKTNWKKIIYILLSIIAAYYILTKCCCKKEEEENVDYDNRWRVSSSSYGGGESYGLRSRGW